MKGVQLITYPDSLGGDLWALNDLLDGPLQGLFPGGVHVLPPFPSTADRGFAPVTYRRIDPSFGSWEDIRRLASQRPVLLDLMINHVSRKSEYFQDVLRNGEESEYADMFITLDKVWPDGVPKEEDIAKIFLRRSRPYSEYTVGASGRTLRFWTTFGKSDPSEQIDIDVNSEAARSFITGVFRTLAENGVTIVRLDAVAYVTNKAGTSCFFVEPEIYDFLEWVTGVAREHDIELLPEIHADYATQLKLAEAGYWIYDFVLPYMVLEALITGQAGRLAGYLADRPPRQFTMLDCHDGLPVKPDLDGLVDSADARRVVDVCLARGGEVSRVHSEHHKAPDGFDVHQISGTLYSLLGEDEDALVAARAIQLFVPGVPQVYYVGLLAGANDREAMEATGDRRSLNRHNYTKAETEAALERPVVQRILWLIRFRNEFPAFDGEFSLEQEGAGATTVRLSWENYDSRCTLTVDLRSKTSAVEYRGGDEGSGEIRRREL
jgi:sucrose 6(F)-phosphate phosphorylase